MPRRYLFLFLEFGEHNYERNFFLPHHCPEIIDCIQQRPLCSNVGFLLPIVTLEEETEMSVSETCLLLSSHFQNSHVRMTPWLTWMQFALMQPSSSLLSLLPRQTRLWGSRMTIQLDEPTQDHRVVASPVSKESHVDNCPDAQASRCLQALQTHFPCVHDSGVPTRGREC